MALINSIISGCTRILTNELFIAQHWFHLIELYNVTYTFVSSALAEMALECEDIVYSKMDSLRYLIIGGARMSGKFPKKFAQYMVNGKIGIGYGVSEMGGLITSSISKRDSIYSAGYLLPDIKARVIGEDGSKLGPERTGQICLKPLFMFLVMLQKIHY